MEFKYDDECGGNEDDEEYVSYNDMINSKIKWSCNDFESDSNEEYENLQLINRENKFEIKDYNIISFTVNNETFKFNNRSISWEIDEEKEKPTISQEIFKEYLKQDKDMLTYKKLLENVDLEINDFEELIKDISKKSKNIIKFLLKDNIKNHVLKNHGILLNKITNKKTEIVKFLLEILSSKNEKFRWNYNGMNLLHFIMLNDPELCLTLLQNVTNCRNFINKIDDNGDTAMHYYLVKHKDNLDENIFNILLMHGSNMKQKNKNGISPQDIIDVYLIENARTCVEKPNIKVLFH